MLGTPGGEKYQIHTLRIFLLQLLNLFKNLTFPNQANISYMFAK
jgi:hypothetical protein